MDPKEFQAMVDETVAVDAYHYPTIDDYTKALAIINETQPAKIPERLPDKVMATPERVARPTQVFIPVNIQPHTVVMTTSDSPLRFDEPKWRKQQRALRSRPHSVWST